MNRRTFVTTTVPTLALLSGCLAGSDDSPGAGGDPSDDSDEDPSTESNAGSSDNLERYAVAGTERTENALLEREARVLEGDLRAPDSPLRIEVTLTNASDETLTYGERRSALFWSALSDANRGFTLRPHRESAAGSAYEFDEESAYWVATEAFVTTDDYQVGVLEPGESHSETLIVLADHQSDPPETPPAEISFESTFRVSVGDDSVLEETGIPVNWAFTLALDEDGTYTVRDDSGGELPLRYAVDLPQADIRSSDEPVRVDVSLTNEADVPLRFGERRTALFWWRQSGDFVLYPKNGESDGLYERDDDTGLWVVTDGVGMTDDYQTDTLEPGETHTETLLLLHQPAEEGELAETPPEELSFETSVSLVEFDGASVDGISMRWGFTLEKRLE